MVILKTQDLLPSLLLYPVWKTTGIFRSTEGLCFLLCWSQYLLRAQHHDQPTEAWSFYTRNTHTQRHKDVYEIKRFRMTVKGWSSLEKHHSRNSYHRGKWDLDSGGSWALMVPITWNTTELLWTCPMSPPSLFWLFTIIN